MAVQGLAADAEQRGRAALIPLGPLEHVADVARGELLERENLRLRGELRGNLRRKCVASSSMSPRRWWSAGTSKMKVANR